MAFLIFLDKKMQTISFNPTDKQQFQFQCSLAGETVTVFTPYNNYSNRYYVKINDSSGNTRVFMPLVFSPDNYDINLAIPFEPGTLIYRSSMSHFEAN
nr:conserved hypothetical phage protein [Arsenophonus nasoniae]